MISHTKEYVLLCTLVDIFDLPVNVAYELIVHSFGHPKEIFLYGYDEKPDLSLALFITALSLYGYAYLANDPSLIEELKRRILQCNRKISSYAIGYSNLQMFKLDSWFKQEATEELFYALEMSSNKNLAMIFWFSTKIYISIYTMKTQLKK